MSLDPSQVAAVLVTKGDVDMQPIIDELPYGEVFVWDNSKRLDYKVFGRYMGMLETTMPVIYTQDDDCLVHNHQQLLDEYEPGVVTGNIQNDVARIKFYRDTTMLGWGSIFDRTLPWQAFARFARFHPLTWHWMISCGAEITFPMLSRTKTIPVDIGWDDTYPVEWLRQDGLDVFGRANRMSNQPGFYKERDQDLLKARRVVKVLELKADNRVLPAAVRA